MTSVVTLIIEKSMEKYSNKKLFPTYQVPTLIFLRYETGTTGIFLCPTRLILLSQCQTIVHVQGPDVLTQLVAALFP